jgi:hypothetical protein
MASSSSRDKTQKLLFDAAVQIAVHDGTDNSVFQQLVGELQSQSQPLSTSVGEIANLYDIPAADAMDELVRAGCRVYWWNGTSYSADGIRQAISDAWQWEMTPEIEVDLTPEQRRVLDGSLGGSEHEEEAAGAQKPLRKFIASEPQLPQQAHQRQQQMG